MARTPLPPDTVSVRDAPNRSRFEVHLGDDLAGFVDYRLEPGRIVFTHTEVRPALQGRGLAAALVEAAVEDVADRGLAVVPRCSFVARWIAEHPGYGGLVRE